MWDIFLILLNLYVNELRSKGDVTYIFPLAFVINEELFNIFFNLAFLSTNPTRNFMSKFKELNREGSQPTDDLNL